MIAFDIIGTIYTDAVTSSDGDVLSGGEPLPGFHVNAIPPAHGWEQYRVEPTTKRRVFAGMETETVCYVFPDESAFRDACQAAGVPSVEE